MPTSNAAAYRLNWNPDDAPDDVTEEDVATCAEFGYVDFNWRCGKARIEPGQRLFLMRTGRGPRGLIGVGQALGEPEGGEKHADGRWEPYWVSVRFTALSLKPLVDRSALEVPPLDTVHWNAQTAAARLSSEQSDALERLARVDGKGPVEALPEELSMEKHFPEGAVRQITVNAFERNRRGRKACLDRWGTACAICDIDFGARFGEEFIGLIHVHHLVPMSSIRKEYVLDPLQDLRPVCPNCHAMLHRRSPPLSLDELRSVVKGRD